MGNEQSQLPGIVIADEAIEVSNFWSQYSAVIYESKNTTNLSVFIEDPFTYADNSFWSVQTPLQRCTKVRVFKKKT